MSREIDIDGLEILLVQRFAELTSGLEFDYKPTGGKKAVDIVQTMLPYPDQDYKEAQSFPRIRVCVFGGDAEDKRKLSPMSAIAVGGIWTSGTIEDGSRDINLLTEAMVKIRDQRSFPPLKLLTPCPWRKGDPTPGMEGMQPHPYHFVTMRLEFLQP